jgi:hypothetical protein
VWAVLLIWFLAIVVPAIRLMRHGTGHKLRPVPSSITYRTAALVLSPTRKDWKP